MDFDEDVATPTVVILPGGAAKTGGAVTVTETDGTNFIWEATYTLVTGDTEGEVDFTVDFTDLAGNAGTQLDKTDLTVTPTVTFDKTIPTNQDAVFTGDVTSEGNLSVTIVSSGDATNEVWFAPSGTTTFTAGATMTKAASGTATSIAAPATDGTYKLFVIDAAGNPSSESTNTLTVTNVAPSTTSFTRKTPLGEFTNVNSLVFLATFSEDVTGVDASDFAVNGTTTATVTGVSAVTASTYDVTISGGDLASFDGVVGLNFAGSPSITDIALNSLPNTEPSTDETYTVDNTAPDYTSWTRKNPTAQLVNVTSLTFLATFSEPVSGIDAADFDVINGTIGSVTPTSAAPVATWDVVVNATADGGVGLQGNVTYAYTDRAGNAGNDVGGALTTQEGYTVDTTDPVFSSVDDNGGDNSYKAGETITFLVDLGETGLTVTADLTVINSGFSATQALTDLNDNFYSYTTPDINTGGLMQEGTSVAVTFTATDDAGNQVTNNSLTLILDKTAPTISITTPIEGDGIVDGGEDNDVVVAGTVDTDALGQTITVTFTDSKNGTPNTLAKTTTVTAGGNWTLAGGNEADISAFVDGTVTIDVDVDDIAGNSATTASTTVELDRSQPSLLGTGIVINNQVQPNTITLTFSEALDKTTADDPVNDYTVTNNGGTISYTIASVTANGPGDVMTLTLAAIDPTDNKTYITNTDIGAGIKVTPAATVTD